MAREIEVRYTCDIKGEPISEPGQNGDLDNAWTWDGIDYLFDVCVDCWSRVGEISIERLIEKSRVMPVEDKTAPLTSRKRKSRAKPAAPPREGKRVWLRPEVYAGYYGVPGDPTAMKCPVCSHISISHQGLAGVKAALQSHLFTMHSIRLGDYTQARMEADQQLHSVS